MVAALLSAAVSMVYCSLVTAVCVENSSTSPTLCAILAADCFGGTPQQAPTPTFSTPTTQCVQICCDNCNDDDDDDATEVVFVCKSISDSGGGSGMRVILRPVGGHITTLDQDLVSAVRKALCVQDKKLCLSKKWLQQKVQRAPKK